MKIRAQACEQRTIIRVYQVHLQPPSRNERLVREQLRAAHEYRNDLVAIERGRRSAVRALHDTKEVGVAVEVLKNSTKSTRGAARKELVKARHMAEVARPEEMARIQELDQQIRRDARALTTAFWGTYLGIEDAHDRARKTPLYDDKLLEPNDPRFVRGPRWRDALGIGDKSVPFALAAGEEKTAWWRGDGQLGVQLQKGLPVEDALACTDRRLQIELQDAKFKGKKGYAGYGILRMRIGSEGREPIWAEWPFKMHRPLPTEGVLKWARASVRCEGHIEKWSAELTLELPYTFSNDYLRSLDRDLSGALAVELEWVPEGNALRVASWRDDQGKEGAIVLPAHLVQGIRKPDGIRAVRDLVLNELRPKLSRAIQEEKTAPRWLLEASRVMHLWKSPDKFVLLAIRWTKECPSVLASTLAELLAWSRREDHLRRYENGARGTAIRARRELYRLISAIWARKYAYVLLPDRDLSREARFGEDSEHRFTAGPWQLRECLKHAFGEGAIDVPWRGPHGVEAKEGDVVNWKKVACESWRASQNAGIARTEKKRKGIVENAGGAWSKRKKKKEETPSPKGGAREVAGNLLRT